jgi:RNA polymerase sigma-70 factor (ECF subfamily)
METDSEIIDKVKKGNKEAYGIIVKKYMRKAYFIALGWVGDSNDALDLSQTAFIKAYRHLSKFDQRRPFPPWFYAILRNLCFNFIKRKKSIPIIPLEETAELHLALPEKKYQEDTREIVGRAISSLPDLEREVILLKYFQELSYKEMAEMLNCPIGTIMSRLYYARKKLKEKLEKYFG